MTGTSYFWTNTANTTATFYSANTRYTYANNPDVSYAATPRPAAKTPLEWLREQVEEVCRLARDPG